MRTRALEDSAMDKNKKAYYVEALREAEEIVKDANYSIGDPGTSVLVAAVFACLARHQYYAEGKDYLLDKECDFKPGGK